MISKIVLMVISLLLLQPVAATEIKTQVSENTTSDAYYQKMILHYVNDYRATHHLLPLKLLNPISHEAARHSKDMANKTIAFGHQHFETRVKRLYKEIGDCRGGAENVAYYKLDPKKLVDAWVASPGHRRNIEGPYNVTGIGIAHGKKGWAYYTQIFLRTDDKR